MAKTGTVIDGKYEILRQIGRGGMSYVYLAMDTHLNKQWVVKEVRKTGNGKNGRVYVNSLLAEAGLMKRLDHPSFPRIVDIIDNGEMIFVVMDYIEGESLDKILEEYGAQPEETVIGWAKQLCDALSYLHRQKPPIIYRDMKPANVMLKPEGNIKIIDFGIAREYKELRLADTTLLGTKGYAPPEQYGGQTDARSDIFALGMTMHHLLTGIDPRCGESYAPVRMWNSNLSEGIELIIDKCVQPAAENRYQTCDELLYDLEHPELITGSYKKKQKRKLCLFFVSAVLAAALGISGLACRMVSTRMNNHTYDNLITASTDKVESCKAAIAIYPERTDAYRTILEAYEEAGQFGVTQSSEFLALYDKNKARFDTSAATYAELNYKIGQMYFNYYTNGNGSYDFSARVQRAYTFFALNYENESLAEPFENQSLSDCYYQICAFYKKYILSGASVEEASKENYEALFDLLNGAFAAVDEAGVYDKLSLYNGVFNFLYDQRTGMVQVNMDKDTVLALLDRVYADADALELVNKEQSKNLRQEILENYEDYREAIGRAYENAGVRSDLNAADSSENAGVRSDLNDADSSENAGSSDGTDDSDYVEEGE